MRHWGRLVKNSGYLYVLTFTNYFVGLLLFPFISRVLSVSGFGVVGYGLAYASVFQSIVEYGFMISATAKISQNRTNAEAVSRIVTSTVLAKIILALLGTALFYSTALLVPMVQDNLAAISLFYFSAVVTAMIPDFYYRGVEQMRFIAIRAVISRLTAIALVLMLVRGDSDILFVPGSLLVGNLLALTWTALVMRKQGIKLSRISLTSAICDIKTGFLYFLSRMGATTNQSLGAFVLANTGGVSYDLGLYSGASRLALAGEQMLNPISDSLYPHMINKRDYRLFWRVYLRGLVAWFIICVIVALLANTLCAILLGQAYAEAGGALRILMFGCFMSLSSNMFGFNALAPIGLARHANASILFSLGLNILLFYFLFFTESVSLVTTCAVVSTSNFVIFGYRAIVFYMNRARVPGASHASGDDQ